MKTMMKNVFLLFLIILVIPESFAGSPNGCNANVTATAPDERYTNNGDATITDKWTGLMWQQCLDGLTGTTCATGTNTSFTWQNALLRPGVVNNGSGFANYNDWRLPSAKELLSLIEFQCFGVARNLTMFPGLGFANSWSSTPTPTAGMAYSVAALGVTPAGLVPISFATPRPVLLVRNVQ